MIDTRYSCSFSCIWWWWMCHSVAYDGGGCVIVLLDVLFQSFIVLYSMCMQAIIVTT